MALCEITDLHKSYYLEGKRIDVLRGVNLTIEKGEMVSLIGASGVGKSTFLHVLGTLDMPTSGSIRFEGREVMTMSEAELAEFRNRSIGFVFQFHYLLPEFTALENVMLPVMLANRGIPEARNRAQALLEAVGLGHRLGHKPGELSGGERQRTAVARALVNRPACVLGDEPTGNLDEKTAAKVFGMMLELNREQGTSLVMVTHDRGLARRMDRVLELHDGRLREWVDEDD